MRRFLPWLLVVILPGCHEEISPPSPDLVGRLPIPPNAEHFTLLEIPSDSLWWRWPCCGSRGGFAVDSAGVPYLIINGARSYHPTYIAQNALVYEDSWEKSRTPAYLSGLRTWVTALLQRSDTLEDGAIFPRFDFSYSVHGNPANLLAVGWHSGYTEGMLLSLLVRSARVTNDAAYADAADRAFRALTQTASRRVVHVDSANYYWIDEYPLPSPDLTFNGFGYAIRGLYEYWQWKRSVESEQVLLEALTSIKHYAPQFRVPGKPSLYCLAHRVPEPAYHAQDVMLLRDFYRMTGDSAFARIADDFEADFHPAN